VKQTGKEGNNDLQRTQEGYM